MTVSQEQTEIPWVKSWLAFLLVVGSTNSLYVVSYTVLIYIYIAVTKAYETYESFLIDLISKNRSAFNLTNFFSTLFLILLVIQAFTDSYVQEADYLADASILIIIIVTLLSQTRDSITVQQVQSLVMITFCIKATYYYD